MKIKHKIGRILLSRIFCIILSIYLLLKPDFFQLNSGLIGSVFFIFVIIFLFWILLSVLGFVILIFRKKPALIIDEESITVGIEYQSSVKIPFNEIISVRKKNTLIEILVTKEFSETIQLNTLQKVLLWMDNYGNKSIVNLRTTFINCTADELFELMQKEWKINKEL